MKIAIVNNCVPFVTGGAEYLAEALRLKLIEFGHSAITISIPFKWHPAPAIIENIVACRSMRLANVDLMIGLKFPAYYVRHPNKVLWLLHQFRQVYDLWDTPYRDLPVTEESSRIRNVIIRADNIYLLEARAIYANSEVTSARLRRFNGLESEVLYPPLLRSDHLRHSEYGDYVFYPSRITAGKRQILLVEAARYLRSSVRVVIAGQPETADDLNELKRLMTTHGLEERVTIIPEFISEEQKADFFSRALACVYIPYDEDSYGYVTLEACHCRKATITCTDSGGTSLLVHERVTGRQVSPDPRSIAAAIDELAADRRLAGEWGSRTRTHVPHWPELGACNQQTHVMTIAWFTPFSKVSAIGRFSQAVTDELSKSSKVDLWVSSMEDLLPTRLSTMQYDPELPLDAWWPHGVYDVAVCHLGDNLLFHRKIFEFSRKVPSVIVLHDLVMHHFFAEYSERVHNDLGAYLRRVEARYGIPAIHANRLAASGVAKWIWETERVVEFPMFEECLPGCLAVVTHSRFLRSRVEQVLPCLVKDIPLAYKIDEGGELIGRQALGVPSDRLLLLTVGNVNINKRIDKIIECFGEAPDVASRIYYVVCGSIELDARSRLQSLISAFGLDDVVALHGPATDIELKSFFTAADICINLRNPAMEGGSASLIELMLYGKAGIVSDTGVYAEIPDDCVWKISPNNERDDLADALRTLIYDADRRNSLGACAKQFARQNNDPGVYARHLLEFLDEVLCVKPVLEYAYRTSRTLAELGVQPDMDIVRTTAAMSVELFCRSAAEAPWNKPR